MVEGLSPLPRSLASQAMGDTGRERLTLFSVRWLGINQQEGEFDRVGIGSVDLSAAPVTGVGCQQKLMPSLGGFGLPLSSRADL